MSLGNLPPTNPNTYHAIGNSDALPGTNRATLGQNDALLQQAALNALANTAFATAEDSIFSQKEIELPQDGVFSGLLSYVSSFITQAPQLAVSAAAYVTLPSPGLYQHKIANLRGMLYTLTGANIAAETAKVIALNQVHKFTYFLTNVDLLTIEETQTGRLKNFICFNNGKVELSFAGRAFLNLLNAHTTLLEETFEVNILRAMHNGIFALKEMHLENPFFAVEFVQDTLHHLAVESRTIKSKGQNTVQAATDEEHDTFMSKLQLSIVTKLFPNGSDDIEIPTYFQEFISKKAFLSLQEKALPRKMTKVYDIATSEMMKYKILAKVVQELKNILSEPKGAQPTKQSTILSEQVPPAILYPKEKQDAFNKALVSVVTAFIERIDSKDLNTLKPIILRQIKKQGPKIVEKLLYAQENPNTLINTLLKNSCQKLSPHGVWQTKNGEDFFNFVPNAAPKTRLQHEAIEQKAFVQNQQALEQTISTIAADLDGLISRLAEIKPKVSKKLNNKRLNKIKEKIAAAYLQIKKGLIRAAFKVIGADKRISNLSKKILKFAEEIDLKEASKSVKRALSRKS